MSERDREQLRLWLRETESDEESILGVEDPDEIELDSVEVLQQDDRNEGNDSQEDQMEVEDDIYEEATDDQDRSAPTQAVPLPPTRPAPQGFVNPEFYIGKDKETRWYVNSHMASTSRTQRHNIIPTFHRPGPKDQAKHAATHLESFECLFDDTIIDLIVTYTNIYIEKVKSKFSRERDAKLTDVIEMKSLIGILFMGGVMKSSRRNALAMWDNSKGTGVEIVYVTMSVHRFRFLLRCLRFDDVRSRNQRKDFDKLAPIREIFEKFLLNSQNSFNPSDYLSVDEQLVAFRGNCPFRVYMPCKPAKYGIKIFALVSAANFYTSNLEVYVGTQPDGPFKVSNSSKDVVLRLVEAVSGSNRNITADNWFASLDLATTLLDEHSLTFIATMRGNRRVVPANFLADRDREIHSSIFGYHEKATLVSYVPQTNKAVLAISTMHRDGEIDGETGDMKKPTIITTYNETKFGVDILDKMCVQYDTARNSRRWPLTIFFHLMNVGGVNSLNIYRANHNYNNVSRKDYLTDLAIWLMKPAIQRRINLTTVPKQIRTRGKILLGQEVEERPVQVPRRENASKGRCFVCPRAKDRSTRKTCDNCQNWVCPEHQKVVCVRCNNE